LTATKSSITIYADTTKGSEFGGDLHINNIKVLREKQGLSQAALAARLGVCQQAVAKWESPGCYPAASKLPEIAKALGCTIDELFCNNSSEQIGETA